jgi:hypothetical protein
MTRQFEVAVLCRAEAGAGDVHDTCCNRQEIYAFPSNRWYWQSRFDVTFDMDMFYARRIRTAFYSSHTLNAVSHVLYERTASHSLYILHLTSYNLHLTSYILQLTSYILHLTSDILQLTPYTLHITPYTLHLTHYTLHLTPYALRLTSYVLSLTSFVLDLT